MATAIRANGLDAGTGVSAVGGAAATAALLAAGRAAGRLGLVRLDLVRVLGTLAAPERGRAEAAGWCATLATGALLTLGYREIFRWLGLWPGAAAGMLVGLGNAAASFGAVAALARLHPRPRRAGLASANPLAYGPLAVPAVLLGHALFGAAAGWLIARERRRDAVVSPAFLRWLERERADERRAAEPSQYRRHLRLVPPLSTRPRDEMDVWPALERAA